MFNVAMAKFIISNVAGLSSSYIVKGIINNNVAPQTSIDSAMLFIGKFAIGGMVSEAVTRSTNQRLDDIEGLYHKYNDELNSPK